MFDTKQENPSTMSLYLKIKVLEKQTEFLLAEINRLDNIIDSLTKKVEAPKEKPEYVVPGLFR